MLPPERRLGAVLELIDEHRFFTLHAGRQTGKTTTLMWLEDHLNASGRWMVSFLTQLRHGYGGGDDARAVHRAGGVRAARAAHGGDGGIASSRTRRRASMSSGKGTRG
jgi:hypothetical protein